MPHPADFMDAHLRHWLDAELLFERRRWANADQLYGYSAECGLKAVMRELGMEVDARGVPASPEHKRHVQHLWPVFTSFVTKRRGLRHLRGLPTIEPFADWSHDDRYADREHFDRKRTERHRKAARKVRQMVANQLLEQRA